MGCAESWVPLHQEEPHSTPPWGPHESLRKSPGAEAKGLKIHLWRNKEIRSESFQGCKPFFVLLKGCFYALDIFSQ